MRNLHAGMTLWCSCNTACMYDAGGTAGADCWQLLNGGDIACNAFIQVKMPLPLQDVVLCGWHL